jgi:hypothetical protein
MNEENMIYESDIQDFFFHKLIAAGLAPEQGDLQVISDIVFEYLIEIGVIDSTIVEDYDEEDFEE